MAQDEISAAAAASGASSHASRTANSELKQRKGATAGQAQQPATSDPSIAAEASGKDDGKDAQGKQKVMGRTHSGASKSCSICNLPQWATIMMLAPPSLLCASHPGHALFHLRPAVTQDAFGLADRGSVDCADLDLLRTFPAVRKVLFLLPIRILALRIQRWAGVHSQATERAGLDRQGNQEQWLVRC